MEEELFVPMQKLNELRRKGIRALEEAMLRAYQREGRERIAAEKIIEESTAGKPAVYALTETLEQLEMLLQAAFVERIYLDCNALDRIWENGKTREVISKVHRAGKEIFLAMPHIFRSDTKKHYERAYKELIEADWDGMLVRNLESFVFLREHRYQKSIVTDHHIYQFNSYSKKFWKEAGAESLTAPLELNFRELQEVGLSDSELVVYGYLPMMVSAQCVVHTTKGCTKEKTVTVLKDRYQKEFFVKNQCDYCYNVIYNTAPLVLCDRKEEILSLSPKAVRLSFTREDRKETGDILTLFESVFEQEGKDAEIDFAFTRGHFKRGIK